MEGDLPEFGVHYAITVTTPVADNLEQLECSFHREMEPRSSLSPLCPPVNQCEECAWQRMHVADEELPVRPRQNHVWLPSLTRRQSSHLP